VPFWKAMVQLLTPTPTLSATIHSVTDRQTDGQAEDSIMATADHTACSSRKTIRWKRSPYALRDKMAKSEQNI